MSGVKDVLTTFVNHVLTVGTSGAESGSRSQSARYKTWQNGKPETRGSKISATRDLIPVCEGGVGGC
jgi:hypothetical protein